MEVDDFIKRGLLIREFDWRERKRVGSGQQNLSCAEMTVEGQQVTSDRQKKSVAGCDLGMR